jgi:hypothetical protein
MYKIYISLFFLLSSVGCLAQLDNTHFKDSIILKSVDKNKIFLNIRAFTFSKDNEYTNEILTGNTLFGYHLIPSLSYQPSENVVVQAGGFLWKDFGNDNFTKIQPVFSIKIKLDSLTLISGTLQGSLNHRLIEPLYNFERLIENRLESGFQAIYHKKRWYADTWIDWRNAIYDNSDDQEHISAGFSGSYTLRTKERMKLSLPLQMQIFHKGGNIGTNTTPNTNWFNGAVGVSLSHQVHEGEAGLIKSFRIDNYLAYYNNFSEPGVVPDPVFKKGFGYYFNLLLKTRKLDIMFSYWQGNKFRAYQGGDLYQSVNLPATLRLSPLDSTKISPRKTLSPPLTEPLPSIQSDRELIIIRLMKDFRVMDNLFMTLRLEPHFDLISRRQEFSFGFYINYFQRFKLATALSSP